MNIDRQCWNALDDAEPLCWIPSRPPVWSPVGARDYQGNFYPM